MIIYKLFLILMIVAVNHAEFIQIFQPFNPALQPQLPMCPPFQQQHPMAQQFKLPAASPSLPPLPKIANKSAIETEKPKENMKFILPFLDIEVQYDRNIHVMQEVVQQQIYVLHGHELYQLFVSRQEKRLSLMGYLEGSIRQMEPLGAEIIYWQGNLLLVIALDEYLEIYQLSENVLKIRAEIVQDPKRANEAAPIFEAIQQLTLPGKYHKVFLFAPTKERVMIVVAINFTRLYGKLRTFEWFNTYFDPIEELTVPTLHVVNVIGSQTKYLIIGRSIKHQAKTILTVYEITQPTLQIRARQTLTVQSLVVHIVNYRQRSLIVACSSKQSKCNSFRQMDDGNFNVYKQRTAKELAFDMLASSSRFLMATRQNQTMIFTSHRLDCYGSFISDQVNVNKLIGHHNQEKEDYVLLFYKNPFKILIRIVELELNLKDNVTSLSGDNLAEPDEILASTRHQNVFESTIGLLRSLLLHRKADLDIFRKVSSIIRPKLKELKVREPITLQSGSVGFIKIVGKSLRSPKQILEKITSIRQTYFPQRSKRSQGPFNITLQISNNIRANKIKVKNLIYQGNVIEGFVLNQSVQPWPILTIKPKVITHALNTTELILPQNKRGIRQYIPDLYFDLIPPFVGVSHLQVEYINGIAWQKIYETIFLKNRDTTIQGRLVLQSQAEVNHLTTSTLNGLTVQDLFNLRDPQVVHSDLVISRFFVNNLKADKVNGLKFEDDIVFSGQNAFIESPVIFHNLSISDDLLMADSNKFERVTVNPDELEFKQIYNNRVIINGSLIVNNLKRENNKTKFIIGDIEFEEGQIKAKYLLQQENQNFSYPITFNNAKVTAPYLETQYLNDHLTPQHLTINTINSTKPLLVVFMNAHIAGNLMCQDYKSKIAEIKENLIRPGDIANVTGHKVFEIAVIVDDLNAVNLNHMPVADLVFTSDLENITFHHIKKFDKIIVRNPSEITEVLQASYLNNLPLEDLLNEDYYMDRLYVPHTLETLNIVFHKLNGIPFDDFFQKINIKDDQLVLHKDLIVEGSIVFMEPVQLQHINDVNWQDYLANLVRIHENVELENSICFSEDLTITKDFDTTEINDYDLAIMLNNILMKSKPQLITGLYTFDYLNVSNLDVPSINNIKVSEFIDLSKNHSEIQGDIIVENLKIKGHLSGILDNTIELENLRERLKSLTLQPWRNLLVLNNLTWPKAINDNSQYELLKYFYKNAVKSNQNQIITGNVKMWQPLIEKMQTRLQFPSDIDIDFIIGDGLLKNSSILQIVKGRKEFLKPLYMDSLQVNGQLRTTLLNDIDVIRFNNSLYRLSSKTPVLGPLRFVKPLSIGHLVVQGLVNGLNTSLIYEIQDNVTLPALKINELFIENELRIKNINNMNLEYFLDNRVTLQGPALEQFGSLTFEHLIIEKEALLQNINHIHIDNLVFKHSPFLQAITGHKTIQNSLELAGPAHIMRINEKDLMELYRNSLRTVHNYHFDTLTVEKATFEKGLQVVDNLNTDFRQRTFSEIAKSSFDKREEFKDFLTDFYKKLQRNKKHILYLEYDLNTTIKWANPKNVPTNNTVLHEIARISCCEKQFLKISFVPHTKEIYLQNITTNRITTITNKISIKAENYCKLKYRKVKSKVTIAKHKLLKVFGMKRYIENIYILAAIDNTHDYVVIHALDLPSLKRNEVRIFQIDNKKNSIKDWQGLVQNIGEKLKIFKFHNLTSLVTNGIINNHPALTIYHFNTSSHLFKLQQIIDGDYDLMEMFELSANSQQKQMIISCRKCQRIFIYEISSQSQPNYQIFQIITLKTQIDKLMLFSYENDHYMLVLSQQDSKFYNIYKYSYIQGWLHLTYGYLPDLPISVPLSHLSDGNTHLIISHNSDDIPLILLCNFDNCYLVKAIV